MRSRYSSTAELWQYRRRVVEANWLPQDVKEQFVLFYGLNGLEYAGLGRKVSSFAFRVGTRVRSRCFRSTAASISLCFAWRVSALLSEVVITWLSIGDGEVAAGHEQNW